MAVEARGGGISQADYDAWVRREQELLSRRRAARGVFAVARPVLRGLRAFIARTPFAPPPLPPVFDPRDAAGYRLATPVRFQPPGDTRCISYATAGAMEAGWCRRMGRMNALPYISVTDVFRKSGSREDPERTRAAVARGVLDEHCLPAVGPPVCPDAPPSWWRARMLPITEYPEDKPPLMCRALVDGATLVMTIPVFDNFAGFTGPAPYEPTGTARGAHALTVVGYDRSDSVSYWIVRNSGGQQWGDAGYTRIRWGHPALKPELIVYAVADVSPPHP